MRNNMIELQQKTILCFHLYVIHLHLMSKLPSSLVRIHSNCFQVSSKTAERFSKGYPLGKLSVLSAYVDHHFIDCSNKVEWFWYVMFLLEINLKSNNIVAFANLSILLNHLVVFQLINMYTYLSREHSYAWQ